MGTANSNSTLLDLRHEAVRRLFPASMISKSGHPREEGWVLSRQQRLPIDVFLDDLPVQIFSKKSSNVHVSARRWILLAVWRAAGDLELRKLSDMSLGASLVNSETGARGLAKHIAEFLRADHDWRVAPSIGYRGSRINYSQYNEISKAVRSALDEIKSALKAAQTLAEFAAAERSRLIPPHSAGDVWRQGFVAQLCFAWRDLTERDPTPNGDLFHRFVERCYESLSGNGSTASQMGDENILPSFSGWIGTIRTVVKDLKNRPDWDGLARYERSLDPPGVMTVVSDETFAEYNARLAAKRDAELKALAATPGARHLFQDLAAKRVKSKPRKSKQ